MDISLNAHNHDQFLEQFPLSSFLQSRFWKRFLSLLDKKYWQLNVYDDNRLLAHCLIYTNKLIMGKSYLYSPKGPLIIPDLDESHRKEALELILSQVRDITIATRKREEVFCRIEPNIQVAGLASLPMKPADSVQPKTTIYLRLDTSPEELFAAFQEKTRYNIRLAEKKQLNIVWANDDTALNYFLQLLNKTKSRQRIRSHDKKYYRLLLEAGREFDAVQINYALFQGKPIAANIYITQIPTVTYVHGGFDYAYRNLMAPYLLQWDAIQRAIALKYDFYDFWGYLPSDGSKPSWEGFSRFKAGFSGTVVESPGCFDFIYNQVWYNAYERFQSMRSKIHGS
ncbi:MAG: hypothetical protein A3B31_01290 [Candidatus Komeilibacteria bacterium RIFCSPLOWO2_01_FULL_53_11]|uniref:BioF2-like acetyltransferase domain-containing protein n=1 Tax=Candidatus Komeilibacteria bacterium RIFCSPLOWO2_01_FULL_53_11 TaxID=1798552 RepID=A0A1G2BRD6_9BACT|nr:MAG: hypothetical protein A3B31_01290 [Candidatus Komeilibacteria bacterium RIFCSPLOWO2_01_FULL_53_11]